jgi:hypothetical protein
MPDRVAIADSLTLLSAVTETDFRPLPISHPLRLCLGSYPKKWISIQIFVDRTRLPLRDLAGFAVFTATSVLRSERNDICLSIL